MVNASLNWASIVGIVLAICGAGLYFMRSFKPALARDYDVFFAAIGLLCGGILFFQGWRLDPILQFGQFLLAGTTVFFAYESVRLRGVATDQARRSSYFDEPDLAGPPNGGLSGRQWDDSYDRFDESQPIRRRFSSTEVDLEEQQSERDVYRPRRVSRAAIPEEAESRLGRSPRPSRDDFDEASSVKERRMSRFRKNDYQSDKRSTFGERRSSRQDFRRGTRPSPNEQIATSRGRFDKDSNSLKQTSKKSSARQVIPKDSSFRSQVEDAAFSSRDSQRSTNSRTQKSPGNRTSSGDSYRRFSSNRRYNQSSSASRGSRNRDNSSRFDD